jgi:hypothetical protein
MGRVGGRWAQLVRLLEDYPKTFQTKLAVPILNQEQIEAILGVTSEREKRSRRLVIEQEKLQRGIKHLLKSVIGQRNHERIDQLTDPELFDLAQEDDRVIYAVLPKLKNVDIYRRLCRSFLSRAKKYGQGVNV